MIRNKSLFRGCWVSLSLIISLLYSSCKTGREPGAVDLVRRTDAELLSAVRSNAISYDKFSARLDVDLKPGQKNKSLSAPALLRIHKGRALMLSFQIPIPLLTAEIFRLVVTPDSILLIDRKDKLYLSEAIRDIRPAAGFAFEYRNLEALFTNQLFMAENPEEDTLLKVDQEQYVARICSVDRETGIRYTFTSDYTDRIRKTEIEHDGKSTRMIWSYDHFVPLEGNNRVFPLKMAMVLELPSDRFGMNLSCSKVEPDGDFVIEFQIPPKYKRITWQQAIKIINSL